MNDQRPDPDALLAQMSTEGTRRIRGTLKIFLGYAAGVGKTYTMLENARRAVRAGREVVVGYVEPHGRAETDALLDGLEAIPEITTEQRGLSIREFDIDAALKRKPDLLLLDELAHTNATGCRHAKRWQDVDELLSAGIDVWTTLNVQHIESLNDVIGQVTGVTVKETIPDEVFDSADELELVDLSPDELMERLRAGKVYAPEQARRALENFFQSANLTALREISLRQAARRIHSDVEFARRAKSIAYPWATTDKLLVCVGPSPTTARVIRTAKRMAAALDAAWIAAAVETGRSGGSKYAKEQIAQHLRLAEQLGAETAELHGADVARTLMAFAKSNNITKILIGKTNQPFWRRWMLGSVVEQVLELSGDVDIYVIQGKPEALTQTATASKPTTWSWGPWWMSAAILAACSLLATALTRSTIDAESNIVMIYLASVCYIAYRYGRTLAIAASIAAVLVFDFFFVPPVLTFAVADTRYLLTFAIMLAIAVAISTLTSRLREQMEGIWNRERQTSTLYRLGKQLSSLSGQMFLVSAAGKHVAEICGGEVAVYVRDAEGDLRVAYGESSSIGKVGLSLEAARWVSEHDQIAGAGTNTLPSASAVFFPLIGSQKTLGAIAVRGPDMAALLDPDQRRLLEASAGQLALALERDQMALDAAEARIQAETEHVRSALLSGVSHDLKTPLAAIAGASSSLLHATHLESSVRQQLLESISDESIRLNRLVDNILQMSRLDAKAVQPNKQWHVLEELIGSALHRTQRELREHPVHVHVPADLPLISVDGLLLEQVFINLLENGARHTPPGTSISIDVAVEGKWMRISFSDTGPGLMPGTETKVFDKFYRASSLADAARGSGLGLAICHGIIQSHGGKISAFNRPGGGATFEIRLPSGSDAPQIPIE